MHSFANECVRKCFFQGLPKGAFQDLYGVIRGALRSLFGPMAFESAVYPGRTISFKTDIGSSGIRPGAECKFFRFFRALLFSIRAPLNYQGADVRTERCRSKPISAPKGLGRGANANSSAFSGPFFFQLGPLLIIKGPISGPNDFVQNRYRLLRD